MMEKSPQKKMKANGSLKEPGSVRLGLFKIDAIELTKTVATARKIMFFKNVFLVLSMLIQKTYELLGILLESRVMPYGVADRCCSYSMQWEMLLSDTS